jgi:hypothetical protein
MAGGLAIVLVAAAIGCASKSTAYMDPSFSDAGMTTCQPPVR